MYGTENQIHGRKEPKARNFEYAFLLNFCDIICLLIFILGDRLSQEESIQRIKGLY